LNLPQLEGERKVSCLKNLLFCIPGSMFMGIFRGF